MLSEERVKLMTRMAVFEKNTRSEYIPFTDINKKEYVGIRRFAAFIIYTLIYGVCAAGLIILMLFNLQLSADIDNLIKVFLIAVLLYLLLLVVILYTVHKMSSKRYKAVSRKIDNYRKCYDDLEALYEKEEASTAPSLESVAIATDRFEAEG